MRVDKPLWEPEPLRELAARCVDKTGYARQARYALTHVALLWTDIPCPDSGQQHFKGVMTWHKQSHITWLLLPMMWALFIGMGSRHARRGVLAIYLWSLILTSMLYFGGGKFRVPYDAIIIVLAFDSYGRLSDWWSARSGKGSKRDPTAKQDPAEAGGHP